MKALSNYKDHAILLMRVGLGIMMMTHGIPKLIGGVDKWTAVGGSMKNFGIDFAPAFWGFMAAVAEGIGGLLVVMGLWFRIACFLIITTLIVAAASHLAKGDGLKGASHAIETGIAFVGLFILGPGRFSIKK